MIEVEPISESDWYDEDYDLLYSMIEEHFKYTNSDKAKEIIENWDEYKLKFKKVIPTAYKKLLRDGSQLLAKQG